MLPKRNAARNEQIYNDFDSGMTATEIAKKYELSKSTLQAAVRSHRLAIGSKLRTRVDGLYFLRRDLAYQVRKGFGYSWVNAELVEDKENSFHIAECDVGISGCDAVRHTHEGRCHLYWYGEVRAIEVGAQIEAHHINLEDGEGNEIEQPIARVVPASEEDARSLIGRARGADGRSNWTWVRLQDGTLMLALFPQGDTYLEFSDRGVCDFYE